MPSEPPPSKPKADPEPAPTRRPKPDTCARCAYPLTDLADQTPFPECGTRAGASRTGLLLLDAGNGFRRRTSAGTKIVAASIALDGLVFGCGGVAASLAIATDSAEPTATLRIALALTALLAIPRALGWWMSTHPEPNRLVREPIAAFGIGIRTLVIFQLALATTALIAHEHAPARLPAILLALAAAWLLNWIAGLWYARLTAHRLGDDHLARHATRLAFAPFLLVLAYPISVLLTPLTILIDPIFGLVPTLYFASVTVAVPAGLTIIVLLAIRTIRQLSHALLRDPFGDHAPT